MRFMHTKKVSLQSFKICRSTIEIWLKFVQFYSLTNAPKSPRIGLSDSKFLFVCWTHPKSNSILLRSLEMGPVSPGIHVRSTLFEFDATFRTLSTMLLYQLCYFSSFYLVKYTVKYELRMYIFSFKRTVTSTRFDSKHFCRVNCRKNWRTHVFQNCPSKPRLPSKIHQKDSCPDYLQSTNERRKKE